ncbi:MAG: aminoglycoside phosphotransferase family protein [Clostridia bacterium]|nr:aminoglycoside phosphotransferase family protein [Clostridia bacterium]NCC75934.1 aminoglycoside phosphotransferase family protein [Clostridia bacterium]
MGLSDSALLHVVMQFNFAGQFLSALPYGHGHINDTYEARFLLPGGQIKRYILQSINTRVFRDPVALMENIEQVTSHLRRAIDAAGGDADRETLTLIRTREDKAWYLAEDGGFWRAYLFIEGAVSLEQADNNDQFFQAALAFGRFHQLLQGFPAEVLHETIADFHNTPKRFQDLLTAARQDRAGRASQVQSELAFVKAHESELSLLVEAWKNGDLPLRVTHNDTKLNNVMLDSETGEGICVIDLDTVMPGLALYDYGDAIRYGASTAAEDESDMEKVWFDLDKAEAFTRGFFEKAGTILTPREIELAPWGAKIMTLECGMRFLTDYLNQDQYFKIQYPDHNLVRARTQFKLVADMECKWNQYAQRCQMLRC